VDRPNSTSDTDPSVGYWHKEPIDVTQRVVGLPGYS